MKIAPIGNDITSSTDVYKNQGNFKLIGEGILNFDNKNYPAAKKAFDSVTAQMNRLLAGDVEKGEKIFRSHKLLLLFLF